MGQRESRSRLSEFSTPPTSPGSHGWEQERGREDMGERRHSHLHRLWHGQIFHWVSSSSGGPDGCKRSRLSAEFPSSSLPVATAVPISRAASEQLPQASAKECTFGLLPWLDELMKMDEMPDRLQMDMLVAESKMRAPAEEARRVAAPSTEFYTESRPSDEVYAPYRMGHYFADDCPEGEGDGHIGKREPPSSIGRERFSAGKMAEDLEVAPHGKAADIEVAASLVLESNCFLG